MVMASSYLHEDHNPPSLPSHMNSPFHLGPRFPAAAFVQSNFLRNPRAECEASFRHRRPVCSSCVLPPPAWKPIARRPYLS